MCADLRWCAVNTEWFDLAAPLMRLAAGLVDASERGAGKVEQHDPAV